MLISEVTADSELWTPLTRLSSRSVAVLKVMCGDRVKERGAQGGDAAEEQNETVRKEQISGRELD